MLCHLPQRVNMKQNPLHSHQLQLVKTADTCLYRRIKLIPVNPYCILRGRIKGTTMQCCICHTVPEGGTFVSQMWHDLVQDKANIVPCDTFYAPTHTINYLWHRRECCTQNTAFRTGSRAVFCIQHALPPVP